MATACSGSSDREPDQGASSKREAAVAGVVEYVHALSDHDYGRANGMRCSAWRAANEELDRKVAEPVRQMKQTLVAWPSDRRGSYNSRLR